MFCVLSEVDVLVLPMSFSAIEDTAFEGPTVGRLPGFGVPDCSADGGPTTTIGSFFLDGSVILGKSIITKGFFLFNLRAVIADLNL